MGMKTGVQQLEESRGCAPVNIAQACTNMILQTNTQDAEQLAPSVWWNGNGLKNREIVFGFQAYVREFYILQVFLDRLLGPHRLLFEWYLGCFCGDRL
jgi:hypothetical protein